MAWPPPVLAINRTNATPQTNTHPADHNAVNQAVNDIVTHVQTVTDTQVVSLESSRYEIITGVPGGTTDTGGSGTPSPWYSLAFGRAVPPWATSMFITATFTGQYGVNTGGVFNATIVGPGGSGGATQFVGTDGVRMPTVLLAAAFTCTPGLTVTATVQVARIGGTGILRADGGTTFTFRADYFR